MSDSFISLHKDMNTTERQRKILEIVIKEYIRSARPVSSKLIEENYDLRVSPATIRNDMQELIEREYLYQPHTSAGRVPTDKGYRFVVDLCSQNSDFNFLDKELQKEVEKIRKEIESELSFIREFTRLIAETSSALTISYIKKEEVIIKEGWSLVFNGPEFDNVDTVRRFVSAVSDIEENMDRLLEDEETSLKVYIGGESPFSEMRDFTVMTSPYFSKRRKRGMFAILGPKRMPYEKNIRLVNSIIRFLRDA